MPTIVQRSGPLFDGRAEWAAHMWTEDIRATVEREAMTRIHRRLKTVLQNPTGYYESKIHTERSVNDTIITDTPVVYGPWLEGVGSRNYPVTRFVGYRTFRFVTQALNRQVGMVSEAILYDHGYLREMNE